MQGGEHDTLVAWYLWYAKRQSPQREWCTEHVNQMKWTIKTAVKWDLFLFAFIGPLLAIIGHIYWSLLSNYYQIVYAEMFCRTFTILSILKFAVGLSWHWCRFRQFVATVCRSSPVCGSHVASSGPCRLLEFTPNRASAAETSLFQCSGRLISTLNCACFDFFGGKNSGGGGKSLPAPPHAMAL